LNVKVLDCFAGIGGFSLGLERAGFETVAFCEIEPYCQKVLAHHWPGVPIYDDIRKITAKRLIRDGIRPDVITGGFPCQDISAAGQQAGIDGERSGLWAELARLIGEIQPRYAIMENVTALISGDSGRWFGRVLGDLAQVGYDAEWHCIPASAIGANHHRDRVWIVAYPSSGERQSGAKEQGVLRALQEDRAIDSDSCGRGEAHAGLLAHSHSERGCSRDSKREDASHARQSPILTRDYARRVGAWDVESNVGRVANGVPQRSHRLKSLGNAVVPQIPEIIGKAIMEAESGKEAAVIMFDLSVKRESEMTPDEHYLEKVSPDTCWQVD
jgi:DNA (cytosine-5)-methyltransferase 1